MDDKKLNQLIKKIDIKVLSVLKQDSLLKDFVFYGIYKGEEVLCKIIGKEYQLKYQNLKREALIGNIISSSRFKIPTTGIIEISEDSDFAWLIRKYILGESLSGSESTNDGLFGYDIILDSFLRSRDQILSKIFKGISEISRVRLRDNDKTFFKPRFDRNLEEYFPSNIEKGFGIKLDKQLGFYDSFKQNFFSEKYIGGCMGDLVPANVIVSLKEEDVYLTDLEWFSEDHYMVDIVFLWLFLWRYKDWQEKWLMLSVKTLEEKEMFRFELIRHIIAWYKNIYLPGIKITPALLKKREIFSNHIWTKYLVAAGESFEAIIKVK